MRDIKIYLERSLILILAVALMSIALPGYNSSNLNVNSVATGSFESLPKINLSLDQGLFGSQDNNSKKPDNKIARNFGLGSLVKGITNIANKVAQPIAKAVTTTVNKGINALATVATVAVKAVAIVYPPAKQTAAKVVNNIANLNASAQKNVNAAGTKIQSATATLIVGLAIGAVVGLTGGGAGLALGGALLAGLAGGAIGAIGCAASGASICQPAPKPTPTPTPAAKITLIKAPPICTVNCVVKPPNPTPTPTAKACVGVCPTSTPTPKPSPTPTCSVACPSPSPTPSSTCSVNCGGGSTPSPSPTPTSCFGPCPTSTPSPTPTSSSNGGLPEVVDNGNGTVTYIYPSGQRVTVIIPANGVISPTPPPKVRPS